LNEVGRTPLWGELLPEDLADVGENDQPKPSRDSAPSAKLLTMPKMISWMTESAKVERLPKEAWYEYARQR
jgi:hypothetical protein